jgi:aryl-alcohol dehydrogenase-like predicted oxidoreductase
VDRGLSTFDCADIYTGVEELLGSLIQERRAGAAGGGIQVHTKFVPDLEVLPRIDRAYVSRIIHRSLARLRVERLDLVQFHWWDFGIPGYLDTMGWLEELQAQGKIRHLGVTNFDRAHLEELVEAGFSIVSNQIQYSVLDRRPERELTPFCATEGIALLCYGGLAGGFLTEQYLGMRQPPEVLPNRSLVKYRLIIEEMGGWGSYQRVLGALGIIASRRGVALPAVALRYVLDRPGVAAVITGLDSQRQAEEAIRAMEMRFEGEDIVVLEEALAETKIPSGPVYGLERDREGPHGLIMRYNLSS